MVLEAAPSDTRTGGAAYPTPGVAAPVIAADSDTDIDVGTDGGLLPDMVDFDPTSAWGGGDEITAAIISPGVHAGVAAYTGRMVGGVPDRGLGVVASAEDDFFAGVVDSNTPLAWGDSDEVTTAIPSVADDATVAAAGAAPTVAATVSTTGVKRKRKKGHTAQDARKDQRRRLLAIHGSAPGTDTGSGVRQSDNT